ncbi:hypothetical protein [Streptomyces sviceus]|uniref:hypothetical protein n=1 Tax=Streptomyces sviceus TaxID=285530 RepID=UPI0036EDBDBE
MESEPASRKDQFLLAVAPRLVLDGAVLAATVVGADTVHVCLPRTRAVQYAQLGAALNDRRRARLDPVRWRLHALPHAYVSSESTSLVSWLNGGPARPQGNPPRTYERGVARRPTLVHNAETPSSHAAAQTGSVVEEPRRSPAPHSSPPPVPSPTRASRRSRSIRRSPPSSRPNGSRLPRAVPPRWVGRPGWGCRTARRGAQSMDGQAAWGDLVAYWAAGLPSGCRPSTRPERLLAWRRTCPGAECEASERRTAT